jgi:broad specificity phosphatase PhoE
MQHLYFCRHGEAEFNAQARWAGSTETPLTPKGVKQAKHAGNEAKALQIDYIIASPLSRAYDTAKIIAKAIGYPIDQIDVNSLLVERHFGSLEAQPWEPDFDMDGIADAEPADSVAERARLTLKHLETIPAANILIVSHGHFGRVFRHELHPEIPLRPSPKFPNGEIIQLI